MHTTSPKNWGKYQFFKLAITKIIMYKSYIFKLVSTGLIDFIYLTLTPFMEDLLQNYMVIQG